MYAPQILVSLLALAGAPLVGASTAPAPVQGPGPSGDPAGEATSSPGAELAWPDLLARDARVSFTARSAFEARRALEDPASPPALRIAALMAIGCTEPQAVRERPLLESWAREGTRLERVAALLALGEFGEGGEAPLLEALEDGDELVRGSALVGLARGARRSSRLRVELVAQGGGPDAAMATDALVFALDPAGSSDNPLLRRLLGMRWDAARRFGLVDGRAWSARLLEGLTAEPRFLDGVVFLSASQHTTPGVADHLLAALLESPTEATLRAAVRSMPDELAQLLEAGLWRPEGPEAWQVVVDEIDVFRSEHLCLGLLGQALTVPPVAVEAVRLLARAGVPEPVIGLELEWPTLDARDRCRAAQAWAFAGDPAALGWLISFADDPDPSVRAHVRLARARLGDADEHAAFRVVLEDPDHDDHAATLAAAIEQSDAPLVRAYLETRIDELEVDDRVDVLATLALRGISLARLRLAEELAGGFPPGHRGVRCVRALLVQEPTEFVDLFRSAFPVEDDLVLNVALGLALVEARDDLSLRFLRVALWDDAWDRSVLAALVLRDVGGPGSLRDEVHRIPTSASSRDLRRLGFAIGEWGGLEAVEYLQDRENLQMRSPVLQGAILGALGRRTH